MTTTEFPYKVGRVDGTGPVIGFLTLAAAEDYVATYLTANNPEGVDNGDYYIDGDQDDERPGVTA